MTIIKYNNQPQKVGMLYLIRPCWLDDIKDDVKRDKVHGGRVLISCTIYQSVTTTSIVVIIDE